jgi:superfamily II DNA or RNA helicase
LNALRAQVEALSVDQASDAYTAAVRALKQAEGVAFTEIAKVRHETALAKVPDVVAHLRDCLESEDKLLVMAHHKDVVAAICAELAEFGVVHITGDDSLTARDKAQTAFQTDPGTRVIVCSIMAAGVGITLHAASHVVFAELDWTPGNMMQAEARAHRIGQRKSVLVQHVVLDGSLDCRMAELLIQKQEVIEAVTDRTTAPLPEPELISAETLAQIAGRMCECGHSWNEHIRTANGAYACKHHGCGCRDVVPDNDLPPAQVQAIHTAMRMLASMCDGARALDGHGFNKLDAPFGHAMAANATLTQNMAKASRKLAVKYGKQLPSDLLAACKG